MFPWHHRCTVLAFTLLLQLIIAGIQTYCFPFWVVPWLDEFKMPISQLMLIITVSLLAGAVMASFCGIALDRYRAHWVICIGIIVFALGLVLISMAKSHWEILVLYSTLLAFGLMICGPLGCQTVVARWFTSNRGAALGTSALGVSFGAFVMPPIATAMLATFGWRETFQLLAAATVLMIPASWVILKREPETAESAVAGVARPIADQTSWTTAQVLHNRDFWITVICFAFMMLAYLPVLYSVGVYARALGITQQYAALIASAGGVGVGVGKFTFGKLADKIEVPKLYWFASVGIVLSVVGFSIAGSWQLLMAAIFVISFCFGSYIPLLSVTVVHRFGSASFGRVLGLLITFTMLAAIAPYLFGLLQEFSGSYKVAFLVMMSPLLFAMFAMRWISKRPVEP